MLLLALALLVQPAGDANVRWQNIGAGPDGVILHIDANSLRRDGDSSIISVMIPGRNGGSFIWTLEFNCPTRQYRIAGNAETTGTNGTGTRTEHEVMAEHRAWRDISMRNPSGYAIMHACGG